MENSFIKRKKGKRTRNLKHTRLNNPDFKQWFIDSAEEFFQPSYKKLVEDLMYKVSSFEIESKNSRDVYEFNFNEMQELFLSFQSKSTATLQVYSSILKKYVDFAIQNGKVDGNTNYFNNFTYNTLVGLLSKGKNKNRIFEKEFIYNLAENEMKNRVDAITVLLLFEGVRGVACEDIVNIKMEDINSDKCIIKIKDKDIFVPRRLMNMIDLAFTQETYVYGNGIHIKDNERRDMVTELVSKDITPYLIRPTQREYKKSGNLQMVGNQLQLRTNKLFKAMGYNFVTCQNIYDSGITYRALEFGREKYNNKFMTMYEFQEFLREKDIPASLTIKYNLYKDEYEKQNGNN